MKNRSLKHSDKKSGRKKPRTDDIDAVDHPAPDSLQEKENDSKTPKSKKLNSAHPCQLKLKKGKKHQKIPQNCDFKSDN